MCGICERPDNDSTLFDGLNDERVVVRLNRRSSFDVQADKSVGSRAVVLLVGQGMISVER